MKSYLLVLSLIILNACQSQIPTIPASITFNDIPGLTENQSDTLAKTLSNFPDGTQLALATIQDSSARFIGVERKGDSLFLIENRDSVFEIGSISKVFTSTLLAKEVVANKMALNDPIEKYLEFTLKGQPEIEMVHLSNHTSGLPRIPGNMMFRAVFNQANPYKNYPVEDLTNYLKEGLKMKSTPGEKYAYSNLGVGLLGYLLTQHTNSSYEQLLQDSVCKPYGLKSTTTHRENVESKLVAGRDKSGRETENWDLGVLVGAGGILSNTQDLSQFVLANFYSKDPALSLQQMETFNAKETLSLAMGWHIVKRESGDRWHWHNGGTGGYTSSMGLDLANKRAIILLTNISASHPRRADIDQLCFALLE